MDTEHFTEAQIKKNVSKALFNDTINCKCVYPCIPMEPNIEAPVIKGQQFHCALQDAPACEFQCNTKAELDDHIIKTHRNKTQLQCTVCNMNFRDLDNLAEHMKKDHKKKEQVDSQYTCRSCNEKFETKSDLDIHIKEDHISYKPCRNFATNNCDYNEECRYYHIILKSGEHLCYKCGLKFPKQSILFNHIKNLHDEPCLKYLEGKCTHGNRCLYNHEGTHVQNVKKTHNNTPSEAPHINSHQDFPQIPPREKILVGNKNSVELLMDRMNQLVNQVSQVMTLILNSKQI